VAFAAWSRAHVAVLARAMKAFLPFWLFFTLTSCQDEDNIGDIIVHGRERPLSGTDRIAILRANVDGIRYSHISSGEECALKKFTASQPVRR